MSEKVLASGLDRHVLPEGEVRKTELGKPSPQQLALPFYNLIPHTPLDCLQWKLYVRKRCIEDLEFRALIIDACRRDVCFFANSLCWIFEPRPPRSLPLTLWPDQADVLCWFAEAFEMRRDVGCLAAGTQVLTRQGPVDIEKITSEHEVWDGEEWVRSEGAVYQGDKATIRAYGVRLTPDHLVLTRKGWKRADKNEKQVAVRAPQSCVQPRYGREPGVSCLGRYAGAVQSTFTPCVQLLRGPWDYCVRQVAQVCQLLGGYGSDIQTRFNVRPNRQQRAVLPRKLPMGYAVCANAQSTKRAGVPHFFRRSQFYADCRDRRHFRSDRTRPGKGRVAGGRVATPVARFRSSPNYAEQRREVRPVYDLVNCGPRRRFCVIGDDGNLVLVHNCEKTRGIGVSWTLAVLFYWLWLFTPECKLGMMTKDESVLDGPDSNSLLGKIVYLHEKMPMWLRGRPRKAGDIGFMRRNVQNHILTHMKTGSTIQGFPPMDSKSRGLRFTAFGYDEFAYFPRNAQESLDTTAHNTPCRFFISTWHGHNNMFHNIMRVEKSSMLCVETYWWNNPERWKGAYKTVNGQIEIIDKDYEFPPDYPFVHDDVIRSPWVDHELRKPGTKAQTAREELYGLQAEAGRKLFRPDIVEMAEDSVRAPTISGELDTSGSEPKIVPGDGPVKVWGPLGGGVGGPFCAGCDISFGAGATNSTLEIFSCDTGEQVLEYVTARLSPQDFARKVAEILRWVNGHRGDGHTLLSFENNGDQGKTFGYQLVQNHGYHNVVRTAYSSKVPKGKEPEYLGRRNKDGGLIILAELERAIHDGEAVIRSAELLEELRLFNRDEDGKPEFPRSAEGNGDRAQGAAIAWDETRQRIENLPQERREEAYSELIEAAEEDEDVSWADSWNLPGLYS